MVTRHRIEWADTDASGHWHNSAALRIVEASETSLFERLGILHTTAARARIPRVRVEADFRHPCVLGDRVDVETRVARVGTSSLTMRSAITLGDRTCATVTVTCVHCVDGRAARLPADVVAVLMTAGRQGRGEEDR